MAMKLVADKPMDETTRQFMDLFTKELGIKFVDVESGEELDGKDDGTQ